MIILLIRGVTLPGAGDGILYYLRPKIDRITESDVSISFFLYFYHYILSILFGEKVNIIRIKMIMMKAKSTLFLHQLN